MLRAALMIRAELETSQILAGILLQPSVSSQSGGAFSSSLNAPLTEVSTAAGHTRISLNL